MTLHVTMNKYQVCKRFCYLNVKYVTKVMEELGNPCADTGTELCSLETKKIMSERVVEAVRCAEDMGKMYQYQNCVVNRMSSTATVFNDTIYKNNQTLFLRRNHTISKVSNLQNDVQLYPSMYISCQSRESDMGAFFPHENHAWSQSLASNGIMNHTSDQKLISELLMVLPLCTCLIHTNPFPPFFFNSAYPKNPRRKSSIRKCTPTSHIRPTI